MKTIVTLIFVLFSGMALHAGSTNAEVKVDTDTKGIVTGIKEETSLKNNGSVARLYLFKNSRVKKELSFATKRNNSKLA